MAAFTTLFVEASTTSMEVVKEVDAFINVLGSSMEYSTYFHEKRLKCTRLHIHAYVRVTFFLAK